MVRNIDGQGQYALSGLTVWPTPNTAPVRSRDLLGNNKDIGDLEKHLDDVRKGKGYLSRQITKEVAKKRANSAEALSTIDPSLARLYNGISTGLSYSKGARFISGVEQSIRTAQRLLDLQA
jgi:hypothetical protein